MAVAVQIASRSELSCLEQFSSLLIWPFWIACKPGVYFLEFRCCLQSRCAECDRNRTARRSIANRSRTRAILAAFGTCAPPREPPCANHRKVIGTDCKWEARRKRHKPIAVSCSTSRNSRIQCKLVYDDACLRTVLIQVIIWIKTSYEIRFFFIGKQFRSNYVRLNPSEIWIFTKLYQKSSKQLEHHCRQWNGVSYR